MTINFKVGRKYKTRLNTLVECVAVWSKPDSKGFCVTCIDENGEAMHYRANGVYFQDERESVCDIVAAAPVEVTGWVNVYPDGEIGNFYLAKDEAKESTPDKKAIQVKVTGTYEETK